MTSLEQLTPGVWNIDASHSSVAFVARHLVVSKVRGRFDAFAGAVTIAEQPLASSVGATIEVASINTGDDGRDGHLKSPDFFDAATFPTITFASTGITPKGSDYVLTGNLTIKDVTKPVELALEFNGVEGDPWGGTRVGFSAETEINRKDFGLEWNVVLETGGMLVGETIKIQLEIEAVKATPAA
jgi:polyisoprenoid-binding protein YceI